MNARGSTEVVIASIGLSMGALSHDLYTMIVAMAAVTTAAMPPMLRWALARLPIQAEEQLRLERDAVEAKGFVSRLERLLVVVDESTTGKFASRLAGLVAGSRGMPVTVLTLGAQANPTVPATDPGGAEMALRTAAATAPATDPDPIDPVSPAVDVMARVPLDPPEREVAAEARKGHDLMVIGVEPTVAPDGGFHEGVTRIARGFQGPFAIASARGIHRVEPERVSLDILVPVTGTEISRRGVDVALTLARASRCEVMALYVAGDAEHQRRRYTNASRAGEAALKDIVALADQMDVPIQTAVRVNLAPEVAILRQARLGRHNLIVMGVTCRPGDTLFFGNVAAAVAEASDRSVLFVAS
ncbi:universal stress protein [Microvirga massiliensis]|uniref:universal stress protein n=1 Tax=Microvirga massiliensis TaxID=1033741 RepID=UPI000A972EF6|nr:universal stress protein [Microvirga massiliensis]